MESDPRPFLSAEWSWLAMLNYEVDPLLLRPFVPRGVLPDTHDGRTFMSLVGFRFRRTRVLGLPIPFHRNFEEVNLRFYVRRETATEVRRGVVFIREIVPRRAIAAVARVMYHEPYTARRMRSVVPPDASRPERARYEWRGPRGWHHLEARVRGAGARAEPGSETEFLAEHHWGYTRQRDGGTVEYRVMHSPWRIWPADGEVGGDMAAVYGPAFGAQLSRPAASAFLADGSRVTVGRPGRWDGGTAG